MMPLDIYMFVLFVWLRCVACRILVPLPGTEPMPLQWKHQVLATRPQGKYQNDIFRLDSTLIRLVLLFKKKKNRKFECRSKPKQSRDDAKTPRDKMAIYKPGGRASQPSEGTSFANILIQTPSLQNYEAISLCCVSCPVPNIPKWYFVIPPFSLGKCVKVAQLCPTHCDPMGYTVHGILQARILEWVAFPLSRGFSQPRDQTQVSRIAGRFFTS